jgi:hypothetical protein
MIERVYRPRFSHLVVHTLSNGIYKQFEAPVSYREVAAYIGISTEDFVSRISRDKSRGEAEFLVYSPTTQITNRVRVYYERKVSHEVRKRSPKVNQPTTEHEDFPGG